MSRGTARGFAALVGAVALLTGACTGGDEQVVASGETAEAEVRAAIDATRNRPGRFEGTLSESWDGGESTFRGELAAGDHLVTVTARDVDAEYDDTDGAEGAGRDGFTDLEELDAADDDELPGDAWPSSRFLAVDGRTYAAVQGLEWSFGLDESLPGAGGDDESLKGVEWLDTTELRADEDHMFLRMFVMDGVAAAPFALLDDLQDVEEMGPDEVDGTPTRRFEASIEGEQLYAALGFDELVGWMTGADEATTPEQRETLELDAAIFDYMRERTSGRVELHLDEAGELRRSEVTFSVDIEPRYSECYQFDESAMDDDMVITVDHTAAADVVIEVPDPDTVVGPDRLLEAMGWDDEAGPFGFDDTAFEDRYVDDEGEPVMVQTVDGERAVFDIENDLADFGSVIGVTPDQLMEMDLDELVDAHDRASAALAAMPTTPTLLGDLTRLELEFNVQAGLEMLDLDPSVTTSMSDGELAAAIDAYVEEHGVFGDGVWGDVDPSLGLEFGPFPVDGAPGSLEDFEDFEGFEGFEGFEDLEGFEELEGLEDGEGFFGPPGPEMYEGCPGADDGSAGDGERHPGAADEEPAARD